MSVRTLDVRTVLHGGPPQADGRRLTLAIEVMPLRELITRAVVAEHLKAPQYEPIDEARIMREATADGDPTGLCRELAEALIEGYRERPPVPPPQETPEGQRDIAAAIAAFEAGLFEVRVGGRRVIGVDTLVELSLESQVIFLRAVRLVAG
jgi:hypothetical protein